MPNPNITLGGAPTTIFGFSNLDGGDTAGHNTINQLVWDIETILNASPRLLPAGNTWDFTGKTISVATPSSSAHAATKAYVDGAVSGATPGVNSVNYINLNTTVKKYDVTISGAVAGRCFNASGSLTSASLTSDINATSQPLVTTIGSSAINLTFGAIGAAGDTINILQHGTGTVTITATSGITINGVSNGTITMVGQYSIVTLIFIDSGKVVAVGDYI